MRRLIRHWCDRKATAGIEFALLAPVTVIILLFFYDVTNVVIRRWQVATAANAIARMATTMAATQSNTNILADTNANIAASAIFGTMPFLLQRPASGYGVGMTSVVMTPVQADCTTNCTYVANVAWSLVLQGTALTRRPCGTQARMADGQAPSPTALPVDAFTAAPILVVDVSYNYVPVITTLFGVSLPLAEAAYVGTRIGNNAAWVRLTGPSAATAQCPGYAT